MHQPPNRTRTIRLALAALAIVLLGACSSAGGSTSTPASTTLAARLSSTAKLSILAPRNGQTLSRQTPELHLGLTGARIVSQTTTHIRPDQGQIHLLVDGKLVAMNYGLNERLPSLTPGQHLVQVEFVAAEHAPSTRGSSPKQPSPSSHKVNLDTLAGPIVYRRRPIQLGVPGRSRSYDISHIVVESCNHVRRIRRGDPHQGGGSNSAAAWNRNETLGVKELGQ